jgi:hypothetical protein
MPHLDAKALIFKALFLGLAAFALYLAYAALVSGTFHAGAVYGRDASPAAYWLYVIASLLFGVLLLVTQVFRPVRSGATSRASASKQKKKPSHLRVVAGRDETRDPDKPTLH